jgi:hypothetical protein
MRKQTISVTKKRGRPPSAPTAVVRLPLYLLEMAAAWGAKQKDAPSRSEAIRRLVELGLKKGRS